MVISAPGALPRQYLMNDAAISSGMAFLQGELEKVDARIYEPLNTESTWARDIICDTGGGFVDYSSALYMEFGTTGGNQYGLIQNNTTSIARIQANLTKDLWPTYIWGQALEINYIDQEKVQKVGRNLEPMLDKGLRWAWNKTIDQNCYLGFPEENSTGLLNNPQVTSALAGMNAAGTSRLWVNKSVDEILQDFNTIIYAAWQSGQFDARSIPNHFLLPPLKFGYLTSRLISGAGTDSILTYLLKNNVAAIQGYPIVILPSRWCIGAGAGGTDRMMGYPMEQDIVSFDITVPVNRVMAQIQALNYVFPYVGQFSCVKWRYPQTAYYLDGF